MARKSRRTRRLRVVNPDCAGIDIGKGRHFVAVDPERTEEPVRSFGAFTRDLEEMAAWLASCGVIKVAMESTSVYWIAVYETLERAGRPGVLVEGAGLVLVHPDSDQGAGQVVPTGQTVERLAGEILLNDLALEGDAVGSVGSVLGHGRRSFECPTHRSNQFNPPVRLKAPTPSRTAA